MEVRGERTPWKGLITLRLHEEEEEHKCRSFKQLCNTLDFYFLFSHCSFGVGPWARSFSRPAPFLSRWAALPHAWAITPPSRLAAAALSLSFPPARVARSPAPFPLPS